MASFHINKDIAKAHTLDTDYYTSPAHYEASKEKIFAPSWQFVGDVSLVVENGSAYPFTLLEHYLDEPLVITRDANGVLHCMSNVCTHRGNIVVTEPCKISQLRCGYHGRCFALDGAFASMPEFKEVENFPTHSDDLRQLSLFKWGNLLFTSLAPVITAEETMKEMMSRIPWFPIDKLEFRKDLSKDYHVKAN